MLLPQPAARPSLAEVLARVRTLPAALACEPEDEEPFSVSYSDVASGGPVTFFALRGHAIPSLNHIAENNQSVFSFLKSTGPTQSASRSNLERTQPESPSSAAYSEAATSDEGGQQQNKEESKQEERSRGRLRQEQAGMQQQRVEALEKGLDLVKFGRKGKPHKTQLKLVEARSVLQWVSKSKSADESQIRLSAVRKVSEGHETDVFARFAKSQQYKAKRHLCFSLIFMEGSTIPTLDFMCETEEDYAVAFCGLRGLIFPDQRF